MGKMGEMGEMEEYTLRICLSWPVHADSSHGHRVIPSIPIGIECGRDDAPPALVAPPAWLRDMLAADLHVVGEMING